MASSVHGRSSGNRLGDGDEIFGRFTRPIPTIVMVVGMIASFWLLATAMRSLPLGTAYMVWTGIGAVGSFVVGVVFLAEPVTAMRMAAAG